MGKSESQTNRLGTLFGIGIGPGDPNLLTVKASHLLKQVPHVFAPKASTKAESIARSIVQPHLGPHAVVHDLVYPMTTNTDELDTSWRESACQVANVLEQGHDACFLTLGDPLLYSTYIYLLRALKARLPTVVTETVPGITAFSACASLTNFPVGEGRRPVVILPSSDDPTVLDAALALGGTLIIMKVGERLHKTLRWLDERLLLDKAVMVAKAGLPEQRVIMNLRPLLDEPSSLGYLATMLIHADTGDVQ